MTIYHVEAFNENYELQGTFITTDFRHALKEGKKMYKYQDAIIVYLNYWENERVTMVKVINEDGKLNEDENNEDD